MKTKTFSRRSFLQQGIAWAAAAPLASLCAVANCWPPQLQAGQAKRPPVAQLRRQGRYRALPLLWAGGPPRWRNALDLLGGLGSLVKNKTVTVKLNLTGSDFKRFLGRPVGETYMTHSATAMALGVLLFEAGARRVRFVESTQRKAGLESTLADAGWDVPALTALGKVEFENTRNLGQGKRYSHLRVPGGGYMFSSFEVNHAYEDTDVLVSLAKLKNHLTAG